MMIPYRIVRMDGDPPIYNLVNEKTNEVVRSAHEPDSLSKWAFDNKALHVTHRYDCKKAEEEQWIRAANKKK